MLDSRENIKFTSNIKNNYRNDREYSVCIDSNKFSEKQCKETLCMRRAEHESNFRRTYSLTTLQDCLKLSVT